MYRKLSLLIFIALVIGLATMGFYKESDKGGSINKININDDYKYIAVNQILMWVSNNGDGSHDPRTDGSGFYWPGGENATQPAIFEDGLIWGGKVGREIRVNGNTHRQGLQAGKILDTGTPDDPSLDRYRVFKIRKGFENLPPGPTRDAYEKDYLEWPVEDGAPWVDVDGDGIYTKGVDEPDFIGDEVLWYVANDMDPGRSTFTYGTLPMGLEFQTTIFGFNRTGDLGDMVFKKYVIINKGNTTIRDMILGYWSDTDLGSASDDYTGCDTVLSLGYTYNGNPSDDIYGDPCPAVGYDFFQGPIVPADEPLAIKLGLPDSAKFDGKYRKGWSNLPMTAFSFYINSNTVYRDPLQGTAQGSIEFYNYLEGKVWDGSDFIDPNTGEPTVFVLAGDPVAGTGWYEGDGWPGGPQPDDRRHLMASGKFTMVPGDTQEVVVGILIGVGNTTLNSVAELKRKDAAAQTAYDLNFALTDPPPPPTLHATTAPKSITLWWEANAESYDEGDPLIYGQGFSDTTYTFQGYRLWQFEDQTGANPRLIGIWDIEDSVTTIYAYKDINGEKVLVPEIVGPNQGLRRFKFITTDAYSNLPLKNANPYFFGVTAYGYSPNSEPSFLESTPVILEAMPGKKRIDYTTPYSSGDNVIGQLVEGSGDALVRFKVIDPDALTGDTYRVEFHEDSVSGDLFYSLIDKTTGDTLVDKEYDLVNLSQDEFKNWVIFDGDTSGKKLYDGFQLLVQDLATDTLKTVPTKYHVKNVIEVKGPGGVDLPEPADVYMQLDPSGKWMIKAGGPNKRLNWQGSGTDALGFTNYEIRFTGTSKYYLNGYGFGFPSTIPYLSDSLAADELPFEIWDVGRDLNSTADDVRLAIKIKDNDRFDSTSAIPDKKWTQLPNGDWEEIYAFTPKTWNADTTEYPITSGTTQSKHHKFGALIFSGSIPEPGTVIRIEAWKPPVEGTAFEATLEKANLQNLAVAQSKVDDGISVFPNPYFGSNELELDKYRRFVRFTGLPVKCTIRIYSLSGIFIRRYDKNDTSQYLEWNLLNKDGLPVSSGMYIAYIDMPGIGTKVMKIAIIQEQQYIDRI